MSGNQVPYNPTPPGPTLLKVPSPSRYEVFWDRLTDPSAHRKVMNALARCIVWAMILGTAFVLLFANTLFQVEFFRWLNGQVPNKELGGLLWKFRPDAPPIQWWAAWFQLVWTCFAYSYVYAGLFVVLAYWQLWPEVDGYYRTLKDQRRGIIEENQRRIHAHAEALEHQQRMADGAAQQRRREAEQRQLEANRQAQELRTALLQELAGLEGIVRRVIRKKENEGLEMAVSPGPEWVTLQAREYFKRAKLDPDTWWLLRWTKQPDVREVIGDGAWLPPIPNDQRMVK